jgi:hypothetical protein
VPLALSPPQRKLTNPQSGLAYDLEGPDAAAVTIPPAPTFNSAEMAAEMAEEYWMALLRDVVFINYLGDAEIGNAATSLGTFTRFTGPTTTGSLFRGTLPGDNLGPYVSQFLLRGVNAPLTGLTPQDGIITYGSLRIDQRQDTVMPPANFLDTFAQWLAIQNGAEPAPGSNLPRDPTRRFIRNGRDLGHLVRPDRAYQHYLNAALILMSLDPFSRTIPDRSPLNGTDPGNPYGSRSANQ